MPGADAEGAGAARHAEQLKQRKAALLFFGALFCIFCVVFAIVVRSTLLCRSSCTGASTATRLLS